MATQNPNTNVMYVDYKFWCDSETKVITLDEEMNLNIPNGEMFEFRNNQFFPIRNTSLFHLFTLLRTTGGLKVILQ